MNRRASCVGTFEVFEAAHVPLRTLLAFSQPVNCIFWPIGMLHWLVAASKLHKHRETCCTAEWPFYSFLILCLQVMLKHAVQNSGKFEIRRRLRQKLRDRRQIDFVHRSRTCSAMGGGGRPLNPHLKRK